MLLPCIAWIFLITCIKKVNNAPFSPLWRYTISSLHTTVTIYLPFQTKLFSFLRHLEIAASSISLSNTLNSQIIKVPNCIVNLLLPISIKCSITLLEPKHFVAFRINYRDPCITFQSWDTPFTTLCLPTNVQNSFRLPLKAVFCFIYSLICFSQ